MTQDAAGARPKEPRGIECRRCGCRHLEVVYTRRQQNQMVLRRRECRHCGARLSTVERVIGPPAK